MALVKCCFSLTLQILWDLQGTPFTHVMVWEISNGASGCAAARVLSRSCSSVISDFLPNLTPCCTALKVDPSCGPGAAGLEAAGAPARPACCCPGCCDAAGVVLLDSPWALPCWPCCEGIGCSCGAWPWLPSPAAVLVLGAPANTCSKNNCLTVKVMGNAGAQAVRTSA